MRPSSRPILITGTHRSGSTWVGKMLALSHQTHYISEPFNPDSQLLPPPLLKHRYHYITPAEQNTFQHHLHRLLTYQTPPRRLSRLTLYQLTQRLWGWPRPVVKDPFASLSAQWLAQTFNMQVICLVRHPAGFAHSLQKANWPATTRHLLAQPTLLHDHLPNLLPSQPPDNFYERSAWLWRAIYHTLTHYIAHNPTWLVWRLEDISQDPLAAFETIYRQLNLPFSRATQRKIKASSNPTNPSQAPAGTHHHIQRNSHQTTQLWRQHLSPTDLTRIRHITEPTSHQYYKDTDW